MANNVRGFVINSLNQFNEYLQENILPSYSNKQSDWNTSNANDDSYIKNKPTIPPEVTESTVAGWGFTKNTGSLTIETDPVFAASAAHGISSSDITTWNNKVSNVQGDWSITDSSSEAYIKNKPTIPSITGLATETYVTNKVAGIVNSAPETLDTLNELAIALGNDPNFATTVATQIGEKVSKTELTNQSYVTTSALSNQSYVTTSALSNQSYITQTTLDSASYAGYSYVYAAYSYIINSIIDNELVVSTALVSQNNRIEQLEIAGYVTQNTLSNQGYLTAHQNIKTINSNSLVGNGNISIQENVQGDWNEDDSTSNSYILNKPNLYTIRYLYSDGTKNLDTIKHLINDCDRKNWSIVMDGDYFIQQKGGSFGNNTGFERIINFGIYENSSIIDIYIYTIHNKEANNYIANDNWVITKYDVERITKANLNSLTSINYTYGDSKKLAFSTDIPSITGLATETYVTNKIADLVNSAPTTLDTLNELATALGNDPNFATTTATALGNRVTKDELAGLGYVTQTTLSNQSYVTQTSLSANSYAGYSYVYAAYSYIITSITDNELVISTALNNHESRIDSLENAGYITSFSESDPIFVTSAAHDISSSDITAWNNKVSNVQADWNTSSSSDESYIKNKPTIPAAVTESTVSGWGFTKNTGTLTEETDPTVPSYIKNITETNISDWNDKVSKLELSGLGYITQASLDSNSYAGYSYVYAAYSYVLNTIYDNEFVTATVLNYHNDRLEVLENAGYITSFSETDPTVPTYVKNITETNISNWNNKVSNVQADWNTSSSSDESYIKNKPTIPAAVTESTVSGWGFTKNAGTLTSHATHKLTATNETATSTSGTITFVESLTGTNTATSGDLTVTATRKSVTIPSEVTESTVSGWGFTKNAGTLTSHATHKLTATNETATSTSGTITFVESLTGTNTATSGDLTVTATRKSVTIPTVNDTTITITKGSYTGTFTTNANTSKTINIPNELPSYSSADAGKILSINSSGQLIWITPVSIYTGNGTPDNSQGNNGDIYIQS